MPELKLEWNAEFNSGNLERGVGEEASLKIEGTFVDTSKNENNWAVPDDELPKIAEQLKGSQLRCDHSSSIRDIIGGFTSGTYDEKNKKVLFSAEVDDPSIISKILKGRVRYVSMGATADAFCSKCNASLKPKVCKCEGSHTIIRNVHLKEGSIIAEPAYKHTDFRPVSFVSSVETALQLQSNEANIAHTLEKVEEKIKEENENMTKIDEKEIKETKVEVKAETVQKPAGPDSVVLLGEKMEEMCKKMDEAIKGFGKTTVASPETVSKSEKKDDEDEAKKKEDDEAKIKKMVREEIMKIKKEEDEAKVKKEQPPVPPEDEEVEEKKPPVKKEVKEEPKQKIIQGAKVESAEDKEFEGYMNVDNLMGKAWTELVEASKKIMK